MISDLIAQLEPDPWRREVGFTDHIEAANRSLWKEGATTEEHVATINRWLQRYQPCLFGRAAASRDLLCYCVLTPDDLTRSDDHIRETIHRARREWQLAGFEGRASGFVVVAISPTIANALPGVQTMRFAQRLCELYLLQDIRPDTVYHDRLQLEIPIRGRPTFEWRVGVNYFCAQGDKRWWQDHRFPGGLAFSMNSVGHLVKSRRLAEKVADLAGAVGLGQEDPALGNLDSLDQALMFAMKTIDLASEGPSGRATELQAAPPGADLPRCPIELTGNLAGRNHCTYLGRYHTDVTIPSEYFLPNVARPAGLQDHLLDFTYLFHDHIENPDYVIVGEGLQVRSEGRRAPIAGEDDSKRAKARERQLSEEEARDLRASLYGHRS